MTPQLLWTRRIAQLLVGLFLYGIAIAMMVRAGIGVAPWDVLTQGIVDADRACPSGWSPSSSAPSCCCCGSPSARSRAWAPCSTSCSSALAPTSASRSSRSSTSRWLQGLTFAGGLTLLAVATGLYVGARLGPGPRDGLMTGIHDRRGWRIWIVRTGIEVTVLTIGWLLGGQVGIGTLAFALLIGPMVGVTLPFFRVPEAPVRPATTTSAGEVIA